MLSSHLNSSHPLTTSKIDLKSLRNQTSRLTRWWRSRAASTPEFKCVSLALQGGGAHGAFTWGVLDALLEDSSIRFEALSGSSAGAINAVVMTQGWMEGGAEGARQALSGFWLEVGERIPWPMMTEGHGESISLTATTKLLANWLGMFSPSSLNPMDLNPLRDLLVRKIDFEKIRRESPFQLFVGATHVNTGKLRLFREYELTVDMLLASACLPKIHHTVKIEGEPYWDGGFSANPAVYPLVRQGKSNDILLVLLAPHQHDETPQSMESIEARIQELGFKSHFLREMNMYARELNAPATPGTHKVNHGRGQSQTRFHMIDSNLDVLQRSETKMLAYAPFLELLKEQGRKQTQSWLSQHATSVGKRSTVDLRQWFD